MSFTTGAAGPFQTARAHGARNSDGGTDEIDSNAESPGEQRISGVSVAGVPMASPDEFFQAARAFGRDAIPKLLLLTPEALRAFAESEEGKGVQVHLPNPGLRQSCKDYQVFLQVFEDRGMGDAGSTIDICRLPHDEEMIAKELPQVQALTNEVLASTLTTFSKDMNDDLYAGYERYESVYQAYILKATRLVHGADRRTRRIIKFGAINFAETMIKKFLRSGLAPATVVVGEAGVASAESAAASAADTVQRAAAVTALAEAGRVAAAAAAAAAGAALLESSAAAAPALSPVSAEAVVAVTQLAGQSQEAGCAATAAKLCPLDDSSAVGQAGAELSVLDSTAILPDMISSIFLVSLSTATFYKEATAVTPAFCRFVPGQPTLRRPPRSRLKDGRRLPELSTFDRDSRSSRLGVRVHANGLPDIHRRSVQ